MAITNIKNQYKFAGKGPVDAKALIKTYAELLKVETWQVTNESGAKINTAYNGMITAVWLNKEDASKNGIYFLHDASVTSALDTPNVTLEANWHKIGGVDDLPGLAEQVTALQSELESVKSDVDDLQDSATVVVNLKSELPKPGIPGKIYVVTDEAMTYVWYNNDYLPVGDGGDNDEIQFIVGGGPNA
jgi:hypothetical protein